MIPKSSYLIALAAQLVMLVCAWGFVIYLITLIQRGANA